ncbi:DUF3052 domain-containing protein [Marinicrinis sediminis]|uniref:DUF3052 domain-containing protein n=1 Tax=Marinicrinis sediminis TaxID=1652465 RepID=A0ABW5RDZ4_9BACL
MTDMHPTLKKLQWKTNMQPILIMHAPEAYQDVMKACPGEVHEQPEQASYPFIQIFGTGNEHLQQSAQSVLSSLQEDGLLWLCYPKKSSKTYKGSDCSRESVAGLLAEAGFEPVRQVSIDEDWSALRFRLVHQIKTMSRKFAVTEEGKKRVGLDQ